MEVSGRALPRLREETQVQTDKITNETLTRALVDAGIPEHDVELWHTGGGIMNVTVVTHRTDKAEHCSECHVAITHGQVPNNPETTGWYHTDSGSELCGPALSDGRRTYASSATADAWIMFGDANIGELFFDGRFNAGVFDDRGDREGWSESIHEYSDDDSLNLTTLEDVAKFMLSEYAKYRTLYDETIDHSHDFAWVTVGALRTLLERVSDDVPVVVARDGWYDNIENVVIPGTDAEKAEYVCVTFSLGTSFDCRSQI